MDFPPSKLKSGSGEHVCIVLDQLAEEALKKTGFSFRRYSNISPNQSHSFQFFFKFVVLLCDHTHIKRNAVQYHCSSVF